MTNILTKLVAQEVSIFKDPFTSEHVEKVWLHMYKGTYGYYLNGSIGFKNGQTEGEQKFKGTSFEDILKQMREFLEAL